MRVKGDDLMTRVLPPRAIVGALLLTLPFAAAARGKLITVQFAGTVTSVFVENRPQLQGVDFPDVGDSFTGFYKFDSTAQDLWADSDVGVFLTTLSDTAVGVMIGDIQFEGSANTINTLHNYYWVGDYNGMELTSNPALAEILERFGPNRFYLAVRKDNLFSDPNTLPLSPPSLDGALQRELVMVMGQLLPPLPGIDGFVKIVASLDSLTVVPEPSSVLLLGFALTLSLKTRNRR
jgi:hypothetical protein